MLAGPVCFGPGVGRMKLPSPEQFAPESPVVTEVAGRTALPPSLQYPVEPVAAHKEQDSLAGPGNPETVVHTAQEYLAGYSVSGAVHTGQPLLVVPERPGLEGSDHTVPVLPDKR